MKTYFIGLGGCGVKTLAELSKRLKNGNPNFANDYAFTYVDTDKNTFDEVNPDGDISGSDLVDIGDTVPLAVYNEALNASQPTDDTKRMLEWCISQEPGHMVLPNYPLKDGATAQRMVGHTGIYYGYNRIEKEITRKIEKFAELTQDAQGNRDVDIWVVASSCGGTGSSMILDILYLINRIAYPVANGEPNVKLVLYMPQAFVALNNTNPNHKLNGYSCMEEINFFRSNYEDSKKQTFEAFAVRPTPSGTNIKDFPLFKYMIPICSENNSLSRMSVKQLYPTVAEMIYYMNIGKGAGEKKSNLSNEIVEMLQKSDKKKGITSQRMGYGFRAIKKANSELKEYLEKRALYEVVKYGLLDDNPISNFDKLMKEFANETILSKLITIPDSVVENNKTYDFSVALMNSDSLESQIKNYVENSTKYDLEGVSADVIKSLDNKLDRMLNGDDFMEIQSNVYAQITNDIDAKTNEFILDYGLNHANELLNTVDDFYLEPLRRYICTTLLPEAYDKTKTVRSVCKTYEKDGFRRRDKANVNQCIKNYRDAVTSAVALKITSDIIKKLTEAPSGYLEKLRKGDNNEMSGIINLKKLLNNDLGDFKDKYDDLAKRFRATANDAMTIYLPSLVDIATGVNNRDWAEDNLFDQLYQASILEQREIKIGLEKIKVPERISKKEGKGLKNILEEIGQKVEDRNVFISVIKDKRIHLSTNKEQSIIMPLKNVVLEHANKTDSAAGNWIGTSLSVAITDPELIPKAFEKKPGKLFNSFKDVSRVPVFFPLRPGITMPANNKLMFVGLEDTGDLPKSLGYDKGSNEQVFVKDDTMTDRFIVMRMPLGLDFTMYKYYQDYKAFYMTDEYYNKVRSQFYGCHIHKAFNEYGLNLPQMDNGVNMGGKGISSQLAEKRMEALVRTLFYQHVVNILRDRDNVSYNKIFGFTSAQMKIDESSLTPEMIKFLGLDKTSSVFTDTNPEQFISLDLDM